MTPMILTVSCDLRAEIVARAARQQAARYGEDAAEIAAIDGDNTKWLVRLIAIHGWPGRTLVGPDGAHAAFMLARWAPAFYRARWLGKARDAARHSDVAQRDVEQMAAELLADQQQ